MQGRIGSSERGWEAIREVGGPGSLSITKVRSRDRTERGDGQQCQILQRIRKLRNKNKTTTKSYDRLQH